MKQNFKLKQTCKRVLSLALCLLLCATLLPGAVWAAGIVDSGTCGKNLTWTLDSAGKLTISGTGEMEDYDWNTFPWYGKRSSVNSVEIRSGVTSIGKYAFDNCDSLTSVSILDSVTSIGYGAFHGCDSLTSVSIPDSVTSIDAYAFSFCSSLTHVSIPDSVTSIDYWAFHETPWIWRLGDYAIVNHILLCYQGSETDVTIPDGVTSIAGRAFYECHSLTSVSIPNSVTSIGHEAFYACDSLTSVSIPNSVTSIGDHAFEYCNSLTSASIPKSVTSIGWGAFYDCDSLTSVTIPNSVTSIGGYTFYGCDSLTSVTIPNSVTSIGDWAFSWCTSLTSVSIPNSVTSIGDMAFFYCTSLTSISIPNRVTSIGISAFEECTSLTDVYFTGTEQEWKAIEIGESNDPLQSAIIHFNITGPSVVLSPQNLTVNGVRKNVEKYNIDGYNYFKLRDIAYLLNGTPAQFSVEWDAAANAARIVSGQPYTANGSELVIGADRSTTAVRSPQTIVIDGEVRSDLAAFNLAGNNFFKLRDLGEALGFQVDYDAATNTAVVTTG